MDEIAILASEDTHYSIPKGANLLMLDWLKIPVDFENREIDKIALEKIIIKAKKNGKKYFIVVSNMGTTMFGSVDNPDDYTSVLEKHNLDYKLHIDGAYGGFVYPFSNQKSTINFSNPKISSITIDAHKMLQAPYGTGVFVCRKGLIENVLTKEAEYVEGMDLTLCGSRSGANAVAVWMILFTYGPFGWFEKISVLQMRTQFLCDELDELNVKYFREPFMNIVTIHAEFIPEEIAKKFRFSSSKHNENNKWYKIVLMDHVEVEHLTTFIDELKATFMLKKELRKKYKELRKQLSEDDIEEKSLAIANKVLTLPYLGENLFSYFLTIEEHKEVNTEFILHLFSRKRQRNCHFEK